MTHPQYPTLDANRVVSLPRGGAVLNAQEERPRVPRQHVRAGRGTAGYLGEVELYEPGAPTLPVVDPKREAEQRAAPVLEAVKRYAPAIDSWTAAGGDVSELAMFLDMAIAALTQPDSPSPAFWADLLVAPGPDWEESIETGEEVTATDRGSTASVTWGDAYTIVSNARADGIDVGPVVDAVLRLGMPTGEEAAPREPLRVPGDEPAEKEAEKPHDKERKTRRTKGA